MTLPKFYKPKVAKKLMNLNQYISVITGIAKKGFVSFEHTIKQLS